MEPGDPEEIADKTLELLRDSDAATTLGSRGRELIEREYSYDSFIDGYEQAFLDLGLYCFSRFQVHIMLAYSSRSTASTQSGAYRIVCPIELCFSFACCD